MRQSAFSRPAALAPAGSGAGLGGSGTPGRAVACRAARAAGSLVRWLAVVIAALAGAACRDHAPDDAVTFAHLGLGLTHPAFLDVPAPVGIEPPLARVIEASRPPDAVSARTTPGLPVSAPIAPGRAREPAAVLVPYHVELRARHQPALRLEIEIDHCPSQPRTALALARSLRHGASLAITDVHAEQIAGRSWQRTRFSHAGPAARSDGDLVTGIEYATVAGARLYRVTAYGPPGAAEALVARVAPTLRLDGSDDAPLWPPPAPRQGTPEPVTRAAAAVVAVVAADIDSGIDPAIATGSAAGLLTIRPVAVGSGVTIDAGGLVLTSAHTLHDEARDALHDLFLVGQERDGVLTFVCAGRPARAALDRALDLALIRCDLDPGGGAFAPAGWPALTTALTSPQAPGLAPGDPIWVLGRADTDDGALPVRSGRVTAAGPSTPDPAGADLVTIDVPVTSGMSGGAVVDARGAFLGVIQGFRERFQADHAGVRRTGRIGLVRPASQARALIQARGR
jgi:S1-C subfamily serine protease